MTHSLSSKQYFKENECTAVFYSSGDLVSYFVEIHDHGNVFFIMKNTKPVIFKNIELAKAAAKKYSPHHSFLALDKTYEEFDTINDFDGNAKIREFDYIPV